MFTGEARTTLAAIAAAALTWAGAAAAFAQTTAQATMAPYRAPHRTDGHPDLNGVWQVFNTANYDILPHAARAAMALRPGPNGLVPDKPVLALGAVGAVPAGVGVVGGGTLPYKPEALAKRADNQAHWLERDPEIKCYLPGVPRATYMAHPLQIFQSREALLIAYEYAGAVRNILFQDPGPAPVDSWMGQSVGHWEGDTLVVEVTGQNDSTWFDRAGDFHSDQLKVTERYTPTGPDTLRYEALINDPEVFTRPWTMRMTLYRRVGEDARLQQFKCVEFVEELMYGNLRKEPLK
jgi:hypothetical protein